MSETNVTDHSARTALLLIADSLRVVSVAGWEVAGMLDDPVQRQSVRLVLTAIGHSSRELPHRLGADT